MTAVGNGTTDLHVATGTNDKPVASNELRTALARSGFSGQLLLGYPIIPTPSGPLTVDATFISPELGVVVFDLVEGAELGSFVDRQDDIYNKVHSRLATSKDLVDRRTLRIELRTVTFAPAATPPSERPEAQSPLCNSETLVSTLRDFRGETVNEDVYRSAVSVIGNVTTIRHTRPRDDVRVGSRADKIQKLELSISALDNIQTRAFLETVEGVQRIRGLAGSGKTIVLARKAAYLHTRHPNWSIAVTFNTRSLKGYFRRLITAFSIAESGMEPDWDRLQIMPGWGAPGSPDRWGVYFQFCMENNVPYSNYGDAKRQYGFEHAFEGVCKDALEKVGRPKESFDSILIDEAQDLPKEFIRLCYEMLKPPKRLVYAYDELQTLNGPGVPPVVEIFGRDSEGNPRVTLESGDASPLQDIILEKCYRNSRPVLASAHALGFGIYRPPPHPPRTGIVQMFDRPGLWREIGYEVVEGALEQDSDVVLARTPETSPPFLEEHSPADDLIVFQSFESKAKHDDWVVDRICANLEQDGLRHDDIVVINTNPLTTADNLGPLRRKLLERGVQSHVAGVDTDPDVFFKASNESITFTGIHRAKGNEAAMVYVVHGEECHGGLYNLARIRNRLFTAMTRSKAWVRVSGVGERMESLADEYSRVRTNGFRLSFRYPTNEELSEISTLHRDMDPRQERERRSDQLRTKRLIEALRSGEILLEELEPDLQKLLAPLVERRDG